MDTLLVIKRIKIFVLCFPHLGTLDSWLPVISRMNDLTDHPIFTLIIPDAMILRNFDRDNAVAEISNNIFNRVLIHAYDDIWIEHKSLFNSMEWYQNNRTVLRLFDILKRLIKKRLFFYILIWPLILLRNKIYNKECKIKYEELNKIAHKTDVLLYDIHSERNRIVSNILKLFINNKYSLPHALTMAIDKDLPVNIIKKTNIINKDNNIKEYVYAKFQGRQHSIKYGTDENKICVVGIPRHDQKWIKKIQEESPKLPSHFDNNKTVVLLSRHVSNAYCLFDEKNQSIKNIKKIFIDKLGMRVVVKRHPSEKKERIYSGKNETIYEDVFGLNNYGLTWIYSDLHVFALGKGKKLAINLNTGVVFDMVAMGIPCIDYLDSNRREVTQFTHHGGVVETASNYGELSAYVDKCLRNPGKISELSKNRYKKYFPLSNDISKKIATEILRENKVVV
jgi:hypothetical protein